jgi:hypothetical protein
MASVDISTADVVGLYVGQSMSLTDISKATGISVSTARNWLHKLAMLRTRTEAIKLASADGKLDSLKGRKRPPRSEQWSQRISDAARIRGEQTAKGFSIKPSGYIEITRGPHKGRGQHVVVMEEIIGRPLLPNECVHHKDENRSNNSPENLELMTRAEHARHHALENHVYRKRNENGQFE